MGYVTQRKRSVTASAGAVLAAAGRVGKYIRDNAAKTSLVEMAGNIGKAGREMELKKKKTPGRKKKGVHTALHGVEAVHGEIKRHTGTFLVGNKRAIKNPSKGYWHVSDQGQNIASIAEGKQFVGTQAFINTFNQILTSSGNGYATPLLAYTSLFDANPFEKTTGGNLYGAVTIPNDDRIVLKDVQFNVEFANFTSVSPVVIDVYWLLCRKNTNDYPETCWNNVLSSQASGASLAVQAGSSGIYSGGYPTTAMVGMHPEDVAGFSKIWKTVRKETYELAPGANVQLAYKFVYNKLLDKKALQEQPTVYLQGLSLGLFYIFRGCVGKDVGTTTASIAPCEIGTIWSREYTCFVPSTNRVQASYIAPTLVTGGATMTAVNILDSDTSTVGQL